MMPSQCDILMNLYIYKCLADATFLLLTAGGQAGGDGRHQHSTEAQRVQPGAQSENREQRDAEGDAEGEQRQVELCDKSHHQSHNRPTLNGKRSFRAVFNCRLPQCVMRE